MSHPFNLHEEDHEVSQNHAHRDVDRRSLSGNCGFAERGRRAASQPTSALRTATLPSGVKITYVAPAEGAKAGDTVSVLYTGKLENGQEFDSSAKHGGDPIEFILGKGMVIRGWDEGLQGMQVGEKRTLVIPPSMGYGDAGAGGVIPPKATLTFDVELVGLKRADAEIGRG